MEFSPVAIVLVIVGILAVIIGIRGSNNAVFQTLTGHTTGNSTSVNPNAPGIIGQSGGPVGGINYIPPASSPGSGLPTVDQNPTQNFIA